VFWFRSNSAMDTNSAVADVREDSAEIWTATKSPIVAQQTVAQELGLPQDAVKLNVVQGGGSFGRRLFYDGAVEAARISQAMGVPVKLMWHRADDARVGRGHPIATSRVQMVINRQTNNVLAFNQSHTSVETDYGHGLGEIITAASASLDPLGLGNLGFAQTIFALTQEIPYNFGVVAQTLNEVEQGFNTASMRNIYSPDVRTAAELMNDRAAKLLGMTPLEFRREFLKSERMRNVLEIAAREGGYRANGLPEGIAHGIAVHKEYKGVSACFVEIDARPQTRNRRIRDAQTGPRVRRVVFAIDAGRIINRKGFEAQMQGGINDGIALALTSSMHFRDGHFLEAIWDNYFYTRQWNTPPEVRVILVDSEQEQPGGAGEAGVASTFAAVACALERALGRELTEFPFNHSRDDLGFKVKSFVPPIPPAPTNGLKFQI
jgi:isoquinoline 1-oxidoreductase beta subunit